MLFSNVSNVLPPDIYVTLTQMRSQVTVYFVFYKIWSLFHCVILISFFSLLMCLFHMCIFNLPWLCIFSSHGVPLFTVFTSQAIQLVPCYSTSVLTHALWSSPIYSTMLVISTFLEEVEIHLLFTSGNGQYLLWTNQL